MQIVFIAKDCSALAMLNLKASFSSFYRGIEKLSKNMYLKYVFNIFPMFTILWTPEMLEMCSVNAQGRVAPCFGVSDPLLVLWH